MKIAINEVPQFWSDGKKYFEKLILKVLIFENLKFSNFFLLQNGGTSLIAIFMSFEDIVMILGAKESWIFILWDAKVFYPPH